VLEIGERVSASAFFNVVDSQNRRNSTCMIRYRWIDGDGSWYGVSNILEIELQH
jgi:hypothetical protein